MANRLDLIWTNKIPEQVKQFFGVGYPMIRRLSAPSILLGMKANDIAIVIDDTYVQGPQPNTWSAIVRFIDNPNGTPVIGQEPYDYIPKGFL